MKGCTWSANWNSLWHSSDELIGINGPKVCQENIPHTITPPPPAWTVDDKAGWVHGFMLLVPNSDPTICMYSAKSEIHQTRLRFSSFQRSSFGEPVPTAASAFCSWLTEAWNPTWSSAVVAHPPQGSTCCAFWDAFLHTTIVQNAYLSYCSLLSAQTSLEILCWPLKSTRRFCPQNCHSLDVLCFSHHS